MWQPLQDGNDPYSFYSQQESGTMVLQLKELNSANNPEEQETDFPVALHSLLIVVASLVAVHRL